MDVWKIKSQSFSKFKSGKSPINSTKASDSNDSAIQPNSERVRIERKIKEIIEDKLRIRESDTYNNASFTRDLGADSLDAVELIMEFEKEFGISIPDDKAERITTVGEAIQYIATHH